MDTIMKADIFFFISSIGIIVLCVLCGVLLWHVIRITRVFSSALSKVRDEVDAIVDDVASVRHTVKKKAEHVVSSVAQSFSSDSPKTKKSNKK